MDYPQPSSPEQESTTGLGLAERIAAPAANVRPNEAGTAVLGSEMAVEGAPSPRLVIRGENHSKEPNPHAAFIDWLNFTFPYQLSGNVGLMELDLVFRDVFGFGIEINRHKKHLNYDQSWELGNGYGIFATGGRSVRCTSLFCLSGEGFAGY